MTSRALLLLALLPLAFAHADKVRVGHATYTFEDRNFADVFRRTVVFGHTISADFMKGVISLADGPATVLAREYAKSSPLYNFAEPRGYVPFEKGVSEDPLDALDGNVCKKPDELTPYGKSLCARLADEGWSEYLRREFRAMFPYIIRLETGLEKIDRLVNQKDDTSSLPRRLDLMNEMYAHATAIVGIDALYMSATYGFDECSEIDVNRTLKTFVTRAFLDGKVVVLGNVPKEDYASFSLLNQAAIPEQNEACRQTINRALELTCTPELNCYRVDLERIVAHLNGDGFLKLKDGSLMLKRAPRGGSNQVRPDGVNLSDRGVQYVVEDILRLLKQNPPRSPKLQLLPN